LEAARGRHIRYLRRSKSPRRRVQAAIRSRVQVKAGIWNRRVWRALRQQIALPATLNISHSLDQRVRIERVATTIWHRVDHQSRALCWIAWCDDLKIGNIVNPAVILRC